MVASLTACTEDFTDWFDPQANGPEGAKTATLDVTGVDPIILADVAADSVKVFNASLTADEAATATYDVAFTTEGNAEAQTLAADAQGRVSVAELTTVINNFYGKRPTARTMSGLVTAYVNDNGQAIRKQGTVNVVATPEAPLIESAYYLIGSHNDWSLETVKDYKFNHSGADVYDDPVFTLTVKAPVNENGERVDFWFNIVPESAVNLPADKFHSALIGSAKGNGDDGRESDLAYKVNGADNAFVQYASDGAKFYQISLNMLDYKITITPLSFEEYIYIPGNPQGWNPETAPMLRSAGFDGVYTGYAYMDGEFKFTKGNSWSAGEYNYGNFSTFGSMFAAGDGSNIKCTEPGYYYLTADLAAGSLNAQPVQVISIIGGAIDDNWSQDVDMTYNKADDCWETTYTFRAGEFKFRMNHEWGLNLGGSLDDLQQDGGNLKFDEAGTYHVKLYPSRANGVKVMKATVTKA